MPVNTTEIAVTADRPPSISERETAIGVVTDLGTSERMVTSDRPNSRLNPITLTIETSEPTSAPARMGSRLARSTSSLRKMGTASATVAGVRKNEIRSPALS